MEHYVTKENKKLRYGFTTGTAASLATKAALLSLTKNEFPESVSVMTPKGWLVTTDVVATSRDGKWHYASVKKDAGDDPDITHGALVQARVSFAEDGQTHIDGGVGVGRVTKKGLQVDVGKAAINPVPMAMIQAVCHDVSPDRGINVIIDIPDGEALAKKTFNPQLGIIGGISIIGSSGIVEPMSKKALIDTIETELKVLKANHAKRILLVPGNHGEKEAQALGIVADGTVKISNFVGESLDLCLEYGFEDIVLVGHVGKFVKLSLGIFQTHSREADGRIAALLQGLIKEKAPYALLEAVQDEVTVEGACALIVDAAYTQLFDRLSDQAVQYIYKRTFDKLNIELYMFSFNHGVLGRSHRGNS